MEFSDIIKIGSLNASDLSTGFKDFIESNTIRDPSFATYIDNHLDENLYSIDEIEEKMLSGDTVSLGKKEVEEFYKIRRLCEKKDCSYFRIIKQ